MTDRTNTQGVPTMAVRRRQVLMIYCVCTEADEAGVVALRNADIDAALTAAGLPLPVDDDERDRLFAAARETGEILALGQAALKDIDHDLGR
jgi:hypothetical protein